MLDLIRMKYPEYHPVVAMADLAHTTDNEEIEFKCHQSIAKFVLPELKSIEVRAQINEQRRVVVELFDESLMPKNLPSDVFGTDVLGIDRPKASEIIEAELSGDNPGAISAADMIKTGVRHVLESDE